jgi:S-adenosylmethionine:tRNA ribosyltransferase-isomerase
MRTDLFDYHLPPELIAQTPGRRGESRMLVLHRNAGRIEHRQFTDVLEYLSPADLLVLNDTRVTARRLYAVREGGGQAEVLLLRPVDDRIWEALVRPGKGLKPGRTLTFTDPDSDGIPVPARVVGTTPEGGRLLEFVSSQQRDRMANWGVAPLPPYITMPLPAAEENRYQTVYARNPGSAAAPTAGLHFTDEILAQATRMGVNQTFVTLNIGIDTFRPVRADDIEAHEMHGETVTVSAEAASDINATTGRVIAVGTTSVRSMEAAAVKLVLTDPSAKRRVTAFSGQTHLFITPGYSFRGVDAIITNFHLPKSTLLMLVSAFAGHDLMMHAYAEAVRERYRFYSFGDAMLIL